ncbi:MAG: hypothetical protein U9Q33_01255 [Campylobacterota bacterium]|nr:hypothetical protein [Campylobacterota bacterium]
MDYNNYNTNNKTQVQKQDYTFVYILTFLVIGLSSYIGYIYYSHDMVNKGDLEKKYILKDEVSFDLLPSYEQDRYIEKRIYDNKLYELNSKLANSLKSVEPKIIEKIVEVEKVVEVEKIVEIEKPTAAPQQFDTKKDPLKLKDIYQCYTMVGDIYPSEECVDKLNLFLDKNKDAYKYEVIGVINKDSFPVLDKVTTKENKRMINRVSNLAQTGLSRKRVIEAMWNVKNKLGVSRDITTVNYTIISNEGLAGFIVRAYK